MKQARQKSRRDGFAEALLDWYDRHRRDLPWRAVPGRKPDPYHVWLSEIMLQQTTVATVGPYFRAFVDRWPTLIDLAAADLDAVLHAWQGLGYYARARNLHKCAGVVAADYGGVLPSREETLRTLPGIGAYTAAAVAAIAFDAPAAPVDGNVERVFARLFAVAGSGPALRREVAAIARQRTPRRRAGDFWQAVMDLGATVCRPRGPECPVCPWRPICAARRQGEPERFPAKARRKPRPTRYGVAYFAVDVDGAILLRRRPRDGLLGGMTEVPGTDWRERPWTAEEALAAAPARARWRRLDGGVRHAFTHFALELTILAATGLDRVCAPGIWCPIDRLSDHALPTVMRKVVSHARRELAGADDRADYETGAQES